MKVLFIQKMAGIAGSETYYLNLLPELVRRGVAVEFACVEHPDEAQKNDRFRNSLAEGGVPCHSFQTRSAIPLAVLLKLRRLIGDGGFDLLQTNLIHADLWGAFLKMSRFGRLKLISVKHGYSERYQSAHGFDPAYLKYDTFANITRFAGFSADRIVCISDGLRDFLVGGGLVDRGKTVTISYGFDFDMVSRLLKPGHGRFGAQQIVVVARLVAVKQHKLLLNCLPRLVRDFPELKVVMIGDGPLRGALEAQARSLGIAEHVVWLGFQSNVHDFIQDSDLLVLPSAAEGFGLVVLEAWFNRRPVVAFDVPAVNEIIVHEENGFLVPAFDRGAFEECLVHLLRDPERAAKMGNAGFATYRSHYSMQTLIENTLNLYEEVRSE